MNVDVWSGGRDRSMGVRVCASVYLRAYFRRCSVCVEGVSLAQSHGVFIILCFIMLRLQIVSVDPLVLFYHDGYIRVCQGEYQSPKEFGGANSTDGSRASFITNWTVQTHSPCYQKEQRQCHAQPATCKTDIESGDSKVPENQDQCRR